MPGSMPVRPAPWQAMQAGICLLASPAMTSVCAAREHRGIARWSAASRANGGRCFAKCSAISSQVGVGQVRDQVVHRRIHARAVAKRHELVVEVGGRLAGDAREVAVARALAALAVAGDAALDARLHRIDLAERRHGMVLRTGRRVQRRRDDERDDARRSACEQLHCGGVRVPAAGLPAADGKANRPFASRRAGRGPSGSRSGCSRGRPLRSGWSLR